MAPSPQPNTFQALRALSHARLGTYRAFFGAATDREAYGLHAWNEAISNALSRILAATEIAMRNQFHAAMSAQYGVAGGPHSKDWFNHIGLSPKSAESVRKITCKPKRVGGVTQWLPKVPMPSPDDVVSRLTFGFWPNLLDASDATGQPIDWGTILPSVVPGHRQKAASHWRAKPNQDALYARIDFCNGLRNRIAHHEPIWKAGPLLVESRSRPNYRPAIVQPAPANAADAIARLALSYDRTIELLSWFSPDLADVVRRGEWHYRFLALNSVTALADYKRHVGLSRDHPLDLSSYRKVRDLKAEMRRIKRTHAGAQIHLAGNRVGHFLV